MEIDKSLLNTWNKEKWIEKKRKLSDCVWCECALLEHEDNTKIYLSPEPTEFGIIYEVAIEDIVEIVETGKSKQKLDSSYIISRVYLKKNAVIIRQQWMLATELPTDVHSLNITAPSLFAQKTSTSLLDLSNIRLMKAATEPSPSPSPSPSDKDHPTDLLKGKEIKEQPRSPPSIGVSGIRG